MGVLVDYFAASQEEMARLDFATGPAGAGWPHVDCKGWLDGLHSLAAELTGRDSSEFDAEVPVFDGDEDDESELARVSAAVVQAMAGVDDARLREYADDELLDDHGLSRCTQLRDLARSTVASGRDVYCWISV